MVLALLFLAGHMADYAAKVFLLVSLWREGFKEHFLVLLCAHLMAGMRKAYEFQVGSWVALFFVPIIGVATPLLEALHLADALAAWWRGQDQGRRLPLRAAPLEVILEGLVFLLGTLHLRVALALGHESISDPAVHLEASLCLVLCTSLSSVTVGLVLVDSALSLKLTRALYGTSTPRTRRLCIPIFAAHLAYRACEVAAQSALLTFLSFMLFPQHFAKYLAALYLLNCLVLVGTQVTQAPVVGSSLVIAWPLMFANLPQFVDSPKHYAAAQSASSLVTAVRAIELSAAVSLVAAGWLMEGEPEPVGRHHHHHHREAWVLDPPVAHLVKALQDLRQRVWSASWLLCILVHYICMVIRWCSCTTPSNTLVVPLLPHRPVELPSSGAASIRRGMAMPDIEIMSDKDFWPPALGLSQLLLSAFCERAPFALPFFSSVPSPAMQSSARQTPRPPRLEDFDTIGLIGYGEFGKVFQVRDRASQQTFAVKSLSKEFYARKQMTDKARREISTLNLAQEHPFIVRLVHALETANEWAMIMEYCPGGDLQQVLLTEGCPGLPLQRILKVSAEVTLALEHLHSRGIVFRDLKLENVVLAKDGSAKLTDFGLAKQYRGGRDAIAEAQSYGGVYANFTKTFCGSYGYAAPEVNPRRQMHGFAADLYAFGVLLVMMLTGGEVYHDTREAPFERRLPPESIKELQDVLARLSFDFYWASHNLLQPARAVHRVEIDLHGSVVIMARGRSRGRRPPRPPNSPVDIVAAPAFPPFPEPALFPSEEDRRRWDLALDLIRLLTSEVPQRRGTVATLKEHAFFEEIEDWRFVYPQSWIAQQVKANLSSGRELSARLQTDLEQLPLQVLVSLLDNQEEAVRVIENLELEWELPASSPALSSSPVLRASDPSTPKMSPTATGAAPSGPVAPSGRMPGPEFQLHELSEP